MEMVLGYWGSKQCLYKAADTLGLSVRKFIKAQNAYSGLLNVLVKTGW